MLGKTEDLVQQILKRWPDDVDSWNLQVTVLAHRSWAERRLGELETARQDCRRAFEAVSQVSALNKEQMQAISNIELLQTEARILGVLDTTAAATHPR